MAAADLRLVDAHSHVNFTAFRDDAEAVILRSLGEGIGVVNVGSQYSTSRRAVEMAEKYPEDVWAIIGLHPIHLFEMEIDEDEDIHFTSRTEKFDPAVYRELARRTPKVIGIGECGLDYYHVPSGVAWEEFAAIQERVFRAQIDLALELDLPVMIHARDSADGSRRAHDDILAILKEYAAAGRPVRGDVHCFSGSWKEAERYLELGMFVSFTGIVTYPQRSAEKKAGVPPIIEVARRVPDDRILVETDAPYLAPVPLRGKRNEPAYVRHVAAAIAAAKGLAAEEFEKQLMENFRKLFRVE